MDSEGKSVLPPVHDVPAFLARLRQLKEESGLTLRQLEERATSAGDYLPRSTLSHMLSGRRLPRPELLAAFVRACGHEKHVTVWLSAREALAKITVGEDDAVAEGAAGGDGRVGGGPVTGPVPGPVPGAGAPRTPFPRRLLRARVLVPLAAVGLLAVTAGVLSTRGDEPGSRATPAAEAARESACRTGAGPAGATKGVPRGAVRLRPLSAPGLCLADGKVRDKRYDSQVAVQRPCDQTKPQTTELPKAPGTGRYRIQWHHPEFGTGCLKVLGTGPGKGLLEPWDACERTDLFELVPAKGRQVYVLRTESGRCVGIERPLTSEGSEAVAQTCTSGRHQRFRIESVSD